MVLKRTFNWNVFRIKTKKKGISLNIFPQTSQDHKNSLIKKHITNKHCFINIKKN